MQEVTRSQVFWKGHRARSATGQNMSFVMIRIRNEPNLPGFDLRQVEVNWILMLISLLAIFWTNRQGNVKQMALGALSTEDLMQKSRIEKLKGLSQKSTSDPCPSMQPGRPG